MPIPISAITLHPSSDIEKSASLFFVSGRRNRCREHDFQFIAEFGIIHHGSKPIHAVLLKHPPPKTAGCSPRLSEKIERQTSNWRKTETSRGLYRTRQEHQSQLSRERPYSITMIAAHSQASRRSMNWHNQGHLRLCSKEEYEEATRTEFVKSKMKREKTMQYQYETG